jgi:hypothetical protein
MHNIEIFDVRSSRNIHGVIKLWRTESAVLVLNIKKRHARRELARNPEIKNHVEELNIDEIKY